MNTGETPQRMDRQNWDERYQNQNTPWDLGQAPPVLRALLLQLPPGRRVLVPGAGSGNDALAWAEAGHDVVAVDFAPAAVELGRQRAAELGLGARFVQADVTALPSSMVNVFDTVWEQTCFCALEPAFRDDYVREMARALEPGGTIYGLFWNHGRSGGPPFDISPSLVRTSFATLFELIALEPVPESVPSRQGREFLAVLRRRGGTGLTGPVILPKFY
jgi:methyl halide transferase